MGGLDGLFAIAFEDAEVLGAAFGACGGGARRGWEKDRRLKEKTVVTVVQGGKVGKMAKCLCVDKLRCC